MSKRTLGITRNKFERLAHYKQNGHHTYKKNTIAGSRFSKTNLNQTRQFDALIEMQTIKKPFIEDLSTISTIDTAKPIWMTYYDECQSILQFIESIRKQMSDQQNKRLTCVRLNEQKQCEIRIYEYAKNATIKIKECEKLLSLIKNQISNQSEANAKVSTQIQNVTKKIRAQQKSFVDQRKQFQSSEKASFLELAADHILNNQSVEFEQMIEDQTILDLQSRNQEIKKIVESIFQLNQIYNDLNQLVIIQGSILDRIDENINMSVKHVVEGGKHIVSAQKKQKKTGRCTCGVIMVLLLGIVILLIVLMVRWFK